MTTNLYVCHGCKATFSQPEELPAHRYGVMSKECWAAFTTLLGYESDVLEFPKVRQLTVDAYFAQHPQNIPLQKSLEINDSAIRASIKSVGRHLIGLYCALEEQIPISAIPSILDQVAKHEESLLSLTPPEEVGAITIADFSPEFSYDEYQQFAIKWAQSVWNAWAAEHDTIRNWVKNYTPAALKSSTKKH